MKYGFRCYCEIVICGVSIFYWWNVFQMKFVGRRSNHLQIRLSNRELLAQYWASSNSCCIHGCFLPITFKTIFMVINLNIRNHEVNPSSKLKILKIQLWSVFLVHNHVYVTISSNGGSCSTTVVADSMNPETPAIQKNMFQFSSWNLLFLRQDKLLAFANKGDSQV